MPKHIQRLVTLAPRIDRAARLGLSLLSSLALFSCEQGGAPTSDNSTLPLPLPNPSCSGFFGQPNEQSGLSALECNTACLCEEPRHAWGEPLASSPLLGFRYLDEPPPITEDPYAGAEPPPELEGVACVIDVHWDERSYRLETRPLEDAPPALITHLGPCGACSSMRDLEVYLTNVDLTEPVRSCGLQSITGGPEEGLSCLRALGFSEACSAVWYFNTVNTRSQCLQTCITHLNASYVDETGALNPCLACDEVKSGPIFKAYAGRTRRNSGLPSAICRPCSTVSPVSHAYLSAP